MANEITISITHSASKGGAAMNSGTNSGSFTMAGTDTCGLSQSVGFAAAEVVATGADVGYPADVTIKNLDATNFVTVYMDNGTNKICVLAAGRTCHLPAIPAIPYVKADTAACQCMVWANEI